MPANVALLLAALAMTATLTGTPRQRSSTEVLPIESHGGFRFEKGDCDRDPGFCERRQPKAWTSDEITIVKQAIDEILTRPLGPEALARCRRNGFDTLRRYTAVGETEWSTAPDFLPRPQANLHWDPLAPSIDFNDEFFRDRGLRDSFSGRPGYLVSAAVLLHECMHALDEVSRYPMFRDLVGFVRAGTRWRFIAGTQSDVAAITEFNRQIVKLARLNDRAGMWRANRRFALSMKPVRLPTMSAVRGPGEAFAEIGAHLILEDRARQYLPKEVVAYFDRNVLEPLTRQ